MGIYINDEKKQTVRHYCTTPKIEKAIETLLNEMEEVVSTETHEGIEVTYADIPDYRCKKKVESSEDIAKLFDEVSKDTGNYL